MMYCPRCGDQIHCCGYVEVYHANDGTPVCSSDREAKKRKQKKKPKEKQDDKWELIKGKLGI